MEHSVHHLVGFTVLFLPLLLLGLALSAFWIWMLVDCATNEGLKGNDKIVWILVIIFTHTLGAFIYLIVARPKRWQAPVPPASP